MSTSETSLDIDSIDPGNRTSLDLLVEEASRQLTICNSCRYCEGLCAVFPALERRDLLAEGDISQLANLCHDCRACFDACMYTTGHEFDINVPKVLAAVRTIDYRRYAWPRNLPRVLSGWMGLFAGTVLAALVVVLVAVTDRGSSALVSSHPGGASPYTIIRYPILLGLLLVPALYALLVMISGARMYWRETTSAQVRVTIASVRQAVLYAATLRYLRGGGEDCYYPDDELPSAGRRYLHGLVAYGFALCLLSTVSAGIMQDIVGDGPPYPLPSVPVLSGIVGGVGMTIGSLGLLRLKTRSSPTTSFAQMTIKDYGFLAALVLLSVSGLATFVTRSTPAFGIVLVVHLTAIAVTFAAAPYSKFAHLQYRFLALVRDNIERQLSS
jgi:citrate/tricarballylate utilization protein